MFCKKCGKEVKDKWSHCPYCGNEIPSDYSTENKEKREDESISIGGIFKWIIKTAASGLAILLVLGIISSLFNEDETRSSSDEQIESSEEYIVTTITDIMRYPKQYEDKYVYIEGGVFDIYTSDALYMTEDGTIMAESIVVTGMDEIPEPRPIAGDAIGVYGQVTEQTLIGGDPEINAHYVEILE